MKTERERQREGERRERERGGRGKEGEEERWRVISDQYSLTVLSLIILFVRNQYFLEANQNIHY